MSYRLVQFQWQRMVAVTMSMMSVTPKSTLLQVVPMAEFPCRAETNMRLTFQKQPNRLAQSLKRLSLASLVVCISCTSSYAQDEAPSYAPGSVFQQAIESSGLNDLTEWEAPASNPSVQSSPSDWVPPTTPVEVPQVQSLQEEAPFNLQEIDLGSDDAILVEPPTDVVEPATGAAQGSLIQAPVEVPFIEAPTIAAPAVEGPALQEPLDSTANEDSTVAPIIAAPKAEMNLSFLDPTYTESTDPVYSDSPVIPETPEVINDELIEFESDCLECQEVPASPASAVIGSGGAVAAVGARAANLKGAVGRTVAAGRNVVGKARLNTQQAILGHERINTPVRNVWGAFSNRLAGGESVNGIGQLSFLSFSRDYRGNGRQLSSGTPNLFANGPDEGTFSGVDISYGQRRSGGRGWEARYIGFNPQEARDVSAFPTLTFGGLAPPLNDFPGFIDPNTPQTFGLSGIGLGDTTVADVFEDSLNHSVTRESEFGSFEFNLLRAAGVTRLSGNSSSVVELFAGLRGVSFSETTTFTAGAVQAPELSSAFYSSDVRNSLFGIQIGGRLESQLSKGWGWTFGTRVGIYNNRVENQQRSEFVLADGSRLTPVLLFGDNAGQEFDFEGKQNELAFLGELDFGFTYQFRQRTRARVGFRGIVISNVAIAADQFEDSLFDVALVSEPRTDSDLVVGGFYFGVDHAF